MYTLKIFNLTEKPTKAKITVYFLFYEWCFKFKQLLVHSKLLFSIKTHCVRISSDFKISNLHLFSKH